MKVLHGTWIPNDESEFIQTGCFYLWVETPVMQKRRSDRKRIHPRHLIQEELVNFLSQELGIKANHVFHFDRWWNPAVENQATDRAFRIGQKKNVFVHKFVAIGTLEERIDSLIEDKKKLSSIVVGSDESWLTELDNEAFKELIALNKSAILE